MSSTRTAGWVVGTVFTTLVIFALTWFLVAAPKFEAAGATMLEAENARAQNDILALETAQLRADFENLEAYKAELATLQSQVPSDAALPDYLREIDRLAADHGVFVLDVAPGVAEVFTLPVVAAPAAPVEATDTAAAETSTEGTEPTASADTAAAAAVPAGPVVPEGLVAVPFSVKVIGSYAGTTSFLEAMQTGTDRLFLVTKVDGTRQEQADGTLSKPATAPGDVELSVSGYVYVLQDVVPAPTAPAEGEEVEKAPLPSTDRNPFAPLD